MEIGVIRQVRALIWKEVRMEFRQLHALNGILIQMLATVFVTFLSVKVLDPITWNAVFWIILLFTVIHAVARSFIQERNGTMLYYHQLVDPRALMASKLVYNALLSLLLALLTLLVYSVLLGSLVQSWPAYLLIVLCFSLGIGAVFTMISAISAKAANSHLLMPVLSIPLIIPLILVAVHGAKLASDGIVLRGYWNDVIVLFLLDLLILVLAMVLYPFLWKE